MTERGRREYAAVMHARYEQADKRERGQLLTEYCRTTGCHRKAAIRRLGRPPQAMEMARKSASAEAAQLVVCEAVVQAETKDHLDWELLHEASEKARGKKALTEACEQVEEQEDEHLYHSTGWCRELWIESLGLPADGHRRGPRQEGPQGDAVNHAGGHDPAGGLPVHHRPDPRREPRRRQDHRGVVALNGTVQSEAMKTCAEQVAREVKGVREVVNNLRIQAAAGRTHRAVEAGRGGARPSSPPLCYVRAWRSGRITGARTLAR